MFNGRFLNIHVYREVVTVHTTGLDENSQFFWLFGSFSVRRCSTGTTYSSISVDEKKHQRGGGWRLCTDSRRKQQGFSRIGICSGRALCAPEQFIEIFI